MKIKSHVAKFAGYVSVDILIVLAVGLIVGLVVGLVCYMASIMNVTLDSSAIHNNSYLIWRGLLVGLLGNILLNIAIAVYVRNDYAKIYKSMKRHYS